MALHFIYVLLLLLKRKDLTDCNLFRKSIRNKNAKGSMGFFLWYLSVSFLFFYLNLKILWLIYLLQKVFLKVIPIKLQIRSAMRCWIIFSLTILTARWLVKPW